AIAMAKLADVSVVASDISEKALAVAKSNIDNNGVADKVTLIAGDMFAAVEGQFNLIICNPPYIPSKDINSLQKEVRCYAPVIALDGGKDGLDYYRTIAECADKYLTDGGALALEVGVNQAGSVAKLLEGKYSVSVIKDMQGIERIIIARLTARI
ncbi:MAG: peptide chain release factor N(5)-glutamine methyltransferase, partial [Clostridia bacterium]|nr:peptide chain release factor N(5)-glutamine methyltransferase [Clostridia bacterium]